MPLIHLLKTALSSEREEIKNIIKETVKTQNTEKNRANNGKNLNRITELFSKYNAIEESLKIANALVKEAQAELNVFPDSREKEAILAMAEYTMQRDK